jgi:hypothetical protein
MDPVPETTTSQKIWYLVAPGIEPGTSGSVARNSDHYNTEAAVIIIIQFNSLLFMCHVNSHKANYRHRTV